METIRKSETLLKLEASIAKYPHHYSLTWNPDKTLHSAEHLDSGMYYQVLRQGNYWGLLFVN